jgi:hypothetical protein
MWWSWRSIVVKPNVVPRVGMPPPGCRTDYQFNLSLQECEQLADDDSANATDGVGDSSATDKTTKLLRAFGRDGKRVSDYDLLDRASAASSGISENTGCVQQAYLFGAALGEAVAPRRPSRRCRHIVNHDSRLTAHVADDAMISRAVRLPNGAAMIGWGPSFPWPVALGTPPIRERRPSWLATCSEVSHYRPA